MHESVERGRDAIALFQEIGDRWGEVMATGSVVRALAELGHDDEYADTLAHYRDDLARRCPTKACARSPRSSSRSSTSSRAGPKRRRRSSTTLDIDTDDDSGQLGSADGSAAVGLALLQLGKVDDAIDAARNAATPTPPTTARRCRSGAGSRSRTRPRTAPTTPTLVIADLQRRDRRHVLRPHARAVGRELRAHAAGRARRAARPIDAAYEIATATDAPLEHAIAALARAQGARRARRRRRRRDAADDAALQLDALGLTADGWSRIFDLALADVVTVPS